MALNFEVAQALVGEALCNPTFARRLSRHRGHALREIESAPCLPAGLRLTEEDRLLLAGIRGTSLQDFARGVERLCGGLRPLPPQGTVPAAADAPEWAAPSPARSHVGDRAVRRAPLSAG